MLSIFTVLITLNTCNQIIEAINQKNQTEITWNNLGIKLTSHTPESEKNPIVPQEQFTKTEEP